MTAGIRNPHLPTGCCIPFVRAWPSGRAWTHDRRCAFSPSQKFTLEERNELDRHQGQHLAERVEVKMDLPPVHPACKAADAEGVDPCSHCAPLLHDPTCECGPCSYFDAHVDDDDDREALHG